MSSSGARSMPLPMAFHWDAPVRLNVREATRFKGKDIKLKYDLVIEDFAEREDHLLVSFANVTPIEFEGEQVLISAYPSEVRANMQLMLADYYTRPAFIVSPDGLIAGFNVDDSLQLYDDILSQVDEGTRSRLNEEGLSKEALRVQMLSSSEAVWTCLVGAWLEFETPLDERSERAVSLFVVDGAESVPGTYEEKNHGFTDDSPLLVDLERTSMSRGVELARLMQRLVQTRIGGSGKLPDIEGVATAVDRRTDKVRLDPVNLKPHWARCEAEFTIDSKDEAVLPSTRTIKATEFDIQWLHPQ